MWEREGVRPVSQCKHSTASTSLMKTLHVSYIRSENGSEECIGTTRQSDRWSGHLLLPRLATDVCIISLSIALILWVRLIKKQNRYIVQFFLFGCFVLPLCLLHSFSFYMALCYICSVLCWERWEERTEDEIPFSGTLGTHLTLAHSWVCSTGSEHAEVWI